jgi:L-arabinose isomerase
MVDLNDFAQLRVGLLGLGLEAYWPQFSGLKPRLEEHVREIEQYLQSPERTIVNLGMIDSLNKAVISAVRRTWMYCSSTSRPMRFPPPCSP